MTTQEKIQSLENTAYNLRAIYVALVLNGDDGNQKRDVALKTAKAHYDEIVENLNKLKATYSPT